MKEKIKTYLPAMLEKNYSDLDFSRSVQDLLKGTDNEEFKTEIFRSLYDKNKDAVSEYLYGRALGNSSVAKDYFQGAIKKNPLFDGVADLRDPVLRSWVLDRFPAGDVWGVGRATATKLAA